LPTLLRAPQQFLYEDVRVLDNVSVHTYILDWGEEELLQLRNYWRTYASRKELIDFGSRRTRVRYSYDPLNMQYYRQINKGRRQKVPYHSIKLDITRFASNMCSQQREWAQALLSEQISAQDWYTGTARLMKYSFRAVVDIARGSSQSMTVEQQREFSRIYEEELSKFNVYARNVARGSLPVDGRILNAVCSLGKRLNRIFENWRLLEARQNGYVRARRRLTHAEHCRDTEQRHGCVELARRGWQSINVITPIGGATCWDGCLCEMEYR